MPSWSDAVFGGPPKPVERLGRNWADEALGGKKPVMTGGQAPNRVLQTDEGGAALDVATVAGLAGQTEDQIRIYGEHRFPKLSPEERRNRYGIQNGQVVYVGDDGQLHAELPFIEGIGEMISASGWNKTARNMGAHVGPAMPDIGSTIGGVTTVPFFGGVPGAVAGGAGGEALRQGLSNWISGTEMDPLAIGAEGAVSGVAQGVGLLVARGMDKALASKAAKRMSQYIKQTGGSAMKALMRTAEDFGIILTPAELSNSPFLRGVQKSLSGLPQSAQTMEDFYVNRAGQTAKINRDFFGSLSPIDSAERAGEMLGKTSADVVAAAKGARRAAGSPAYKEAFASGSSIDLKPIADMIDAELPMAGPHLRASMLKLKREIYGIGGTTPKQAGPTIEGSLEAVQNRVKETLDDMISAASRQGRGKAANRLSELKEAMLADLDARVPKYAAARAQWGDLSRPVDAAEGSVLANFTGLTPKDWTKIPQRLFAQGPEEIGRARRFAVAQPGGEDAWNAVLRSYLEGEFTKAGKIYASNIARPQATAAMQGPKFYASVFGDATSYGKLKQAMAPDQFRTFNKIMNVLEATGRGLDVNSDTAFKQAFNHEIKRIASGPMSGRVFNANPLDVMRELREFYADAKTGRNIETLVRAFTSKDGVAALNRATLSAPGSPRAIIAAAQALGIISKETVTGLTGPSDALPAALQQYQQPQR